MSSAGYSRSTPLAIATLIAERCSALDLHPAELVRRAGYKNAAKGRRRLDGLLAGELRRTEGLIAALPTALDVTPEAVERAIDETRQQIADAEQASWRSAFKPDGVILTERIRPSQFTFCALTGGPERWLTIPIDASQPPVTFIGQVLAALPRRTSAGEDGRRYVQFFGAVTGFVVNYSPDNALRCSLAGEPMAILDSAYRPCEVQLWIGRKRVPTALAARVLGLG